MPAIQHRIPKGTGSIGRVTYKPEHDPDRVLSRGGHAPKPPACATARACEAARTFNGRDPDRWNTPDANGETRDRAMTPNAKALWHKGAKGRAMTKGPKPQPLPIAPGGMFMHGDPIPERKPRPMPRIPGLAVYGF